MRTPEDLERLKLDVGPADFNFAKKGRTGRTTRMLELAVAEAALGKDVVIACPDTAIAMYLMQMADDVARRAGLDHHEIRHRLSFEIVGHEFNWTTLRPPGVDDDVIVLIDHSLIEQRFRPVLREWCRFDEP